MPVRASKFYISLVECSQTVRLNLNLRVGGLSMSIIVSKSGVCLPVLSS